MRATARRSIIAAFSFAAALAILATHPAEQRAAAQQTQPAAAGAQGVFKRHVDAHWFNNNAQFWYRNDLAGGAKEFVIVSVEAAKRHPAFDHQKLAAAVSKAAGKTIAADKLPFDAIEPSDDGKSVRFTVGDTTWKCDLGSYTCVKSDGSPVGLAAPEEPALANLSTMDDLSDGLFANPQQPGRPGRGAGAGGAAAIPPRVVPLGPVTSPDGKWTATINPTTYNITLHSAADNRDIPLSQDGRLGDAYCFPFWSPDSTTLVAFRMQPGDRFVVNRIQSSPDNPPATGGGTGRVKLQSNAYALAGDKFDAFELNVFDVASQKQTKPKVERLDMSAGGSDPTPAIKWKKDGFHFTFEKYDRGHQRVRVIEANAHTGELHNIIDEKAETFVWTAHADAEGWKLLSYLKNENEIVYCSEMDGWRHLYLADSSTPAKADQAPVLKQITKGQWVVRGFDASRDATHPAIDEKDRVIYFTASGIYGDQDPYLVHNGHINFDGTGLVWMTEGNGNHTIKYSPDFKYIIDTYDRVDMAPVTELRRVADGKKVCDLEKADVQAPWNKPEVFVAKGRDGKTDIWGVVYRPPNFDASKKYPVIEDIYAGPHGSFVPKSFSLTPPRSARTAEVEGSDELLLNLGFVIVHIDGMGTAHRSRAFHDVCWQNLADSGFPDRILWMKALGAKYSFMDLARVGIFGTSSGGQSAAAALLFHPEFYKVAVANSGCHDSRMDKASWNEQWMGYPVGPQYSRSSNIDNAAKLQGRLELIVGELDTNVPPESTNRFVDALIKANRIFDYVMVPGADHGAILPGEVIVPMKLTSYFQRYLLGVEPANPNVQATEKPQ